MPTADERTLAGKVEAALKKNPDATVLELAESLDSDHDTVVRVLDEFHVEDDGKLTHKGPGRGGGWHPARLAEAAREEAAQAAADSAEPVE